MNKFGNKKGAIVLLVFIVLIGFFSGIAMSEGIIKPTGKLTFMAAGCMNPCTPGSWIEDRSYCCHWKDSGIPCICGTIHYGDRHVLKVRCTMTFDCHYSETVIEDYWLYGDCTYCG